MKLEHYIRTIRHLVVSVSGDMALPIQAVTADSRKSAPGTLFVAVPGATVDGTLFLDDAIKRGAVAVVVSRPVEAAPGTAVIQVDDAYTAHAILAEVAAGRPAVGMRFTGVTGTNGKTTCAFVLRHILAAAGRKAGMIGTVRYQFGDGSSTKADRTTPGPEQLQELLKKMKRTGCEDVVAECSSHALSQRRFGTTQFAAAIFTNLTGDHLDYHLTEDAYFQAKCRLFTEYLAKEGVAVVNTDDARGRELVQILNRERPDAQPLGYGESWNADYRIRDCSYTMSGMSFRLETPAGDLSIKSPLLGRFNALNITATCAVAVSLGIPVETIGSALEHATGAPGRVQSFESNRGFCAVVDYAHTDDALRNVLETLRELNPERLTVVFGCGGDRDRSKRPRMATVAAELADKVIITSDNPRTESPNRIIDDIVRGIGSGKCPAIIPDRAEAIAFALQAAVAGEIVLIAGKGHEDYQEIAGRKYPFSDAEVVQTLLCCQ